VNRNSQLISLVTAFAVSAALHEAHASPARATSVKPEAPPPAPAEAKAGGSSRTSELWESEGRTLRELASVAGGADKAEALLRLGEWERQSANRLRRDIEEKTVVAPAGEEQIAQHLVAAQKAFAEAEALASPDRLPQVLFALGDLLRFQGNPKAARAPLAKLVEKHAQHPLAVDAAIALGDDAFDAGNLADAMSRFEFAAQRARADGARAYAKYKLAWCHLNLNEYADARQLFLDVISLASGAGKAITLADEARRDFVLALARDARLSATDAETAIGGLALTADRTRRYVAAYAKIIAGSGRDDEAMKVLAQIEAGAPLSDAASIFTAELEIAIRRRDLASEARVGAQLAQVISAFPAAASAVQEAAEHALRVAAVTVHGEGRARGDRATLESAASLYGDYFLAFNHSEAAYELHHHAGELLAGLKRPAESEEQYSAAVVLDLSRMNAGRPAGKWIESSAQGAVTAAQEALPPAPATVRQPPPAEEDVDHAAPAPTEMLPAETVFVSACERYLKALPKGPQAVEVRYQRALMLYRHNMLDQAESELRQVALEHSTEAPAVYAAQLSLDALHQLGRYDDMASVAGELLERPALRAKIGDELQSIREAALLASAARDAKHQQYAVAAKRYLDFAKSFPRSSRLDRALYNAATALVQDGQLAEGVAVRERLLRELPASPLAPRARERQLAEFLQLGRFSEAERTATALASETKGAEAVTRLRDAVVLAEAAGDSRAADGLRQTYVNEHPRGPEAMTYALILGEHSRGCEPVLKAYGKALSIAVDPSWRAVALSRLARQEARCHKDSLAARHAAEAAALTPHLKKDRADALDASADAALLLTESVLGSYRKLPLREPFERTLPKKLSSLKSVDEKLAQVIARGRAEPAVCALVQSGEAYGQLAKELNEASPPRAFNAEQKELFKEQLAEKSQPFFERAKTTLTQAITRAREAGVEPRCLSEARRSLAALWPERFGPRQAAVAVLTPAAQPPVKDAAGILAKNPDAPAAWLIAAQAELADGHPGAAIVLTSRIESNDPLFAAALETKAGALEALGQPGPALTLWLRLIKEFPDRPLGRRILADRTLANRDLEAAKEHLLALRQIESKDAGVALNLGVALRELGDVEGAEKATRAAEDLAPDRIEAALNLGLLLCDEAGRPAEGVTALERFAKNGGHPPDGHRFEATLAACRMMAKEKK
jgi:tetratricopeptide (TPR) repeat protein